MKQWSNVKWVAPREFEVEARQGGLCMNLQNEIMNLTDRSFTQLCSLAVVKEFAVGFQPPQQACPDILPDGEANPLAGSKLATSRSPA